MTDFEVNVTGNSRLILQLIEKHGYEAERHLFRCLFSFIDFAGDGKNNGKDFLQVINVWFQKLSKPPPRKGFFVWTLPHPRNFQLSLTLSLTYKFWLLRLPSPLEFPMTFYRVGMDIFRSCTIQVR